MWSCLTSILVFTSIMLAFSKFLEGRLFDGAIIGWLVAIVIIILIVVYSDKKETDKLCLNPTKYKDG